MTSRVLQSSLRQVRSNPSGGRTLHTSAGAMSQPILNRYSRTITQPKAQGASQAMLYATEGIDTDDDLNKPMVGVASIW